jgi:hypothetical protein
MEQIREAEMVQAIDPPILVDESRFSRAACFRIPPVFPVTSRRATCASIPSAAVQMTWTEFAPDSPLEGSRTRTIGPAEDPPPSS